MADAITYYAIVNDFSSRDEPFGVIRRVKHDGGQRDETFARDLHLEAHLAALLG